MGQVCIHDENKVAGCMLYTMDVGSAKAKLLFSRPQNLKVHTHKVKDSTKVKSNILQ